MAHNTHGRTAPVRVPAHSLDPPAIDSALISPSSYSTFKTGLGGQAHPSTRRTHGAHTAHATHHNPPPEESFRRKGRDPHIHGMYMYMYLYMSMYMFPSSN